MEASVDISINTVSNRDLRAFFRPTKAGRSAAALDFEPLRMRLTRLGASDAS